MAILTINFNANTTGDHYVGYKETNIDPPNTYTVITVNVAAPGPQSVDIDIVGSLYCGELNYNGYVIAACQAQDDVSPVDGIPDNAIQWSETLLQQIDPCIETEITCNNTGIESLIISVPGTGYSVSDVITVVEATLGDEVAPATITVSSIGAGGDITGLSIDVPGSYKAAPNLDATAVGNGDAVIIIGRMEDCPSTLAAPIVCEGVDSTNPPELPLILGETEVLCVDVSTLAGLPSNFTTSQVGNCKCRGCESLSIDTTAATSGVAVAQYHRCWDRGAGETLVNLDLVPGVNLVDVDCIIPETFKIISSSLDSAAVVTYGVCASA